MQEKGITVTILGSGTCVPSLSRSSSAISARINWKYLLFDMGPGTTRRLLESGRSIFDISYLFLTHFHPDHTGELASFLFSRKYGNHSEFEHPLTIIGGRGLIIFYQGLKTAYGHWIETNHHLPQWIEMDNCQRDFLEFEGFTVKSIPMKHNEESVAFRITNSAGVSFVYSGDTDYCTNLVELSDHADLLICESSFPDGHKTEGHLTPSLAGEIARQANVRQLALTHFYPECDEADLEKQCRKTYQGPLILAEDLMEINLMGS
jgi:ribonuclease BN (tRNA processing enzyme)